MPDTEGLVLQDEDEQDEELRTRMLRSALEVRDEVIAKKFYKNGVTLLLSVVGMLICVVATLFYQHFGSVEGNVGKLLEDFKALSVSIESVKGDCGHIEDIKEDIAELRKGVLEHVEAHSKFQVEMERLRMRIEALEKRGEANEQ